MTQPTADSPASGPPDADAAVAALIASRHYKRAVDRAKEHHARLASPASEALLVDAYVARLLAFDADLVREADALFGLLASRYPSARARLEHEVRPRLDARFGRFERLLAPLVAVDVPDDVRARIESALRTDLTDLPGLSACPALPSDHALRQAAAALAAAFAAVTSGPTDAADLALPAVSRRSPLRDWKPLVRALAAFHRGDDAECARQLAAVGPDSAPGRLVPVLSALSTSTRSQALRGEAERLAVELGGDTQALRATLGALDADLARGKRGALVGRARQVLTHARRGRPDLVPRLLQHLSVRGWLDSVPAERLRAALGERAPRDAYFYRLIARAAEHKADPYLACVHWENFRRHALDEGWFGEHSAEAAALDLHLAEWAGSVEPLPEVGRRKLAQALDPFDRPALLSDGECERWPDAARYFARSCACQPTPGTFRRWTEWARAHAGDKAVEQAALAWHAAHPTETRALLLLAEVCERRDALHKALRFIERAERVDRLDPEVGRTRARLLARAAVRRLREHKPRLAAETLDDLAQRPDAGGGRPAVVAALRWLVSVARDDGRDASLRAELERLAGDADTARALLDGLAGLCQAGPKSRRHELQRGPHPPAALANAALAAAELGLWLAPGDDWLDAQERTPSAGTTLSQAQVRALAELSLRRERHKLAYTLSGLGLARASDLERARFLLLRALSLPEFAFERRTECRCAAAALARRHGQNELLAEIAAARSGRVPDDVTLDAAAIEAVVRREREAPEYPRPSRDDERFEPLCQCPDCRRERAVAVAVPREDDALAWLADADDDEIEDPEEDDEPLPPRIAALLQEMMRQTGTTNLDPEFLARRHPDLFARLLAAVAEERGETDFNPRGFRVAPRRRRNRPKRR